MAKKDWKNLKDKAPESSAEETVASEENLEETKEETVAKNTSPFVSWKTYFVNEKTKNLSTLAWNFMEWLLVVDTPEAVEIIKKTEDYKRGCIKSFETKKEYLAYLKSKEDKAE